MEYIFEPYKINEKEKKFWEIIGIVLFIITLGIAFILFYDFFCEREHYFNRRRLYKRLKCNRIENIYESTMVINYDVDNFILIYWKNGSGISLHGENDCLLSSVVLTLIDRYYYNKIEELVEMYNDPFIEFMKTFTDVKEEHYDYNRFSLYYW